MNFSYDDIKAQVELALATVLPPGKILRITSEPGIGRNVALLEILNDRTSNVVRLNTYELSPQTLSHHAHELSLAEYIIVDGFSHAAKHEQAMIRDLIVSRTVVTAPVKFVHNGGDTLILRDDVRVIISDSVGRNESISSDEDDFTNMFNTIALDAPHHQ